jgi:hypothetical protein
MTTLSIDSLLTATETRFSTLTTKQLCAIALRARFTLEELKDVRGVVHRKIVVSILMRRYLFGIISALFKTLSLDVFQCIRKFVDFNINLQQRISNYVFRQHAIYDYWYMDARTVRDNSEPQEIDGAIQYVRRCGIRQYIMFWILDIEEHRYAYYQFTKQQNIERRAELIRIKYNENEAKRHINPIQQLREYLDAEWIAEIMVGEIEVSYLQNEQKWLYKYAELHFPTYLKFLEQNPVSLD